MLFNEKVKTSYESQISSLEQSFKSKDEYIKQSVETLLKENKTLRQSVNKRKIKIIKPDGTVIEKEFEESNYEKTEQAITEAKSDFEKKSKEMEVSLKSKYETEKE